MRIFVISVAIVGAMLWPAGAYAQSGPPNEPLGQAMIHPPVAVHYSCSEHWEGQLPYPGDALGADCIIFGGLPADGKSGFAKAYRSDGSQNEDWYGWGETVLAPFDGTVAKVNINPVTNRPGVLGKPPASYVVFRQTSGVMVMIGHVTGVTVKEGDDVKAGQPFAKVGNNGYGRAPHLHIGAWHGKTPLQIRFDLRAMARLRAASK